MSDLSGKLNALYTGQKPGAVRFRYAMMAFDLATVLYFIASAPFPAPDWQKLLNLVLAVIILADLVARFWIAPKKLRYLLRVYVLGDIAVLVSLVLNPFVAVNLEFLRILRGLRLGHSEYLLADLRRDWRFFREHEDALVALLNLTVFVFVTATAVFTFFVGVEGGIEGYVNSIYFTVTTLTTTGYGDITPQTLAGKTMSVIIMIVGVSLFLGLARAIFLPSKVNHTCRTCGLTRHEPDAVHCKHCGAGLSIETKGFE